MTVTLISRRRFLIENYEVEIRAHLEAIEKLRADLEKDLQKLSQDCLMLHGKHINSLLSSVNICIHCGELL